MHGRHIVEAELRVPATLLTFHELGRLLVAVGSNIHELLLQPRKTTALLAPHGDNERTRRQHHPRWSKAHHSSLPIPTWLIGTDRRPTARVPSGLSARHNMSMN